jgi:hypothetical protein
MLPLIISAVRSFSLHLSVWNSPQTSPLS